MPTTDRNQDTQGTTKRSQSSEEGELADTRYKTFSTGNGIRVRTTTAGTMTKYIREDPSYPGDVQEPAIFLSGRWADDVLDTRECYSGSQRLPTTV